MAEPAWMTNLITEARTISDRTDKQIADKKRLDRRWWRYLSRPPKRMIEPRNPLFRSWDLDEFGNYHRVVGDIGAG